MTRVLDFLALSLLYGTVVAAIAWALDRLLRSRVSPALCSALWTVALAKFFVPVGPAVTFSPGETLAPLAVVSPASLPIARHLQATAAASRWPSLLFLAYLLAVAVLLLRRLVAAARLAKALQALPTASPALVASVREAATALGLRLLPAVRTGAGPLVAGWWRPTLVVPFERAETVESRAVLLHELAHLRRGDPWVRLLQGLSQSVFFFWPPVRWVNRKLEQHRELACDQWALDLGAISPAAYARVLLEAGRGALPGAFQLAALEMSSSASGLERRIERVLDLGAPRPRKWAALAVLGCAALLCSGSAFAVNGASPQAGRPGDTALVGALVQEHAAQLRACYEAAIAWGPVSEGAVLFDWTITPAGAFADGCVTGSEFNPKLAADREDELFRCVNAVVRKLRFPPQGGEAQVGVSYRFVFKQGAPPLLAEP